MYVTPYVRERIRSSAKSRTKLKNRRTRAYVRNAEELRFGALLLKKLGMGTNLQSADATAVLGDGGLKPKETGSRSQGGRRAEAKLELLTFPHIISARSS